MRNQQVFSAMDIADMAEGTSQCASVSCSVGAELLIKGLTATATLGAVAGLLGLNLLCPQG